MRHRSADRVIVLEVLRAPMGKTIIRATRCDFGWHGELEVCDRGARLLTSPLRYRLLLGRDRCPGELSTDRSIGIHGGCIRMGGPKDHRTIRAKPTLHVGKI